MFDRENLKQALRPGRDSEFHLDLLQNCPFSEYLVVSLGSSECGIPKGRLSLFLNNNIESTKEMAPTLLNLIP